MNVHHFNIDIKHPTTPRIRLTNGDDGNEFVITLLDDYVEYDMTDVTDITAMFTRSDGLPVYKRSSSGHVTISGNVVSMLVPATCFRIGTNKLALQIIEGQDDHFTTPEITFYASPEPPEEII